MNLFKASNQWANRPDDERFWTVQELDAACTTYRAQARTARVQFKDLRTQAQGDEVVLLGKTGSAKLTHWAFGQLCARAGAPASYLRTLPNTLAAQNLNHGLALRADDQDPTHLLLHPNGSMLCRAMVSEGYTRIWNNDITARLRQLEEQGWRVPPARPAPGYKGITRLATAEDVLRDTQGGGGLSINVGDVIAPAGLYASDHDLFAFMVFEGRPIDGGDGDVLSRGFMTWNSEVGASSFGFLGFLYDHVCGNHIVWGAKGVRELRVRHVGTADERAFKELRAELVHYADESASDLEAQIARAKQYTLGPDKTQVLDRLFSMRLPMLSLKRLGVAYDLAVEHEDAHGTPNTAWGMASGITRLSQTLPYADERVAMDRAAGKILEMAF